MIHVTRARSRAADRILTDRCRITRDAQGTGDDTLNPTTLELVTVGTEPVYDGPCLLGAARPVRLTDQGDQPWTEADTTVRVSADCPTVLPGDLITVLTGDHAGVQLVAVGTHPATIQVTTRIAARRRTKDPVR
jgi:hypothetical protein